MRTDRATHHDEGPAPRLPRPRGTLTGRQVEVSRLADDLCAAPGLVSVTGAGGIGKTRVAVEVAHRVAPHLADGAVFVGLAGVADPADVPAAIAGRLRLAASSHRPPTEALASGLRHRELLLVLDNLEHLLAAGPSVQALVASCTRLRVLVTSRSPLGVDAEREVELAPLGVPDAVDGSSGPAAVDRLAEVDSVRLFVERVAEIDDEFVLDAGNAPLVVRACRLLGGSPLAIELAAARTRLLSLDQLVTRIAERPLTVLATPEGRDRDDRQRSVRATIAWSHDLLSPNERAVFRQLAAFEHGFSLDAAEAVALDGGDGVLDALDALVDAHLVEPSRSASDGPPRFALPVPVRDLGREHLRESGEHDEVHARIVGHARARASEAGEGLETEREAEWLGRVELDLDQIRATLALLRTRDPEAHLRMATALGPFWLHRGLLGEGRRHLAPALDPAVASTVASAAVAAAAAWDARLAADLGVVGDHPDAPDVIARLERGLAAARAAGDVDGELRHLDFLSHVLVLHDDDTARAVAVTDEGIALARRHRRPWWLAQLLQRAAVFARLDEDLDAAGRLAAEAFALSRRLGAERLVLHAGLTVVQLPPDPGIADAPGLDDLLASATRLGDQRMACTVVMSLGIEAMLAGRVEEGATHLHRAVQLSRDTGYWHAIGFSLMCTAAFAAVVSDHETAAQIHGAARATIPVLRRGMPPAYFAIYEDLVATTRAALGHDRFAEVADSGAALGWDLASDVASDLLAARAVPPASARPIDADLPAALTPREREVLSCIAEGDTNKDIARRLSITPKTVMHHTTSIYRKLDARGRAEAVAIGQREGLIPP